MNIPDPQVGGKVMLARELAQSALSIAKRSEADLEGADAAIEQLMGEHPGQSQNILAAYQGYRAELGIVSAAVSG